MLAKNPVSLFRLIAIDRKDADARLLGRALGGSLVHGVWRLSAVYIRSTLDPTAF
jgi:hypothetical protein